MMNAAGASARHGGGRGTSLPAHEKWIALAVFGLLAIALCVYQSVTIWAHNLDTAFLLEALRHVREQGEPLTYLGPAFLDAFDSFYLSAEALCRADLRPSGQGLSILGSHAYYMIYPLAWLSWLAPEHLVLAVANGLAFAGFVAVLYWVLRDRQVPIIVAATFCVLAMAHPVWSFGQVGDVYLDRFFIPLGLLYAAQLHALLTGSRAPSAGAVAALLGVALLTVIATERAAIMVGYMSAVFLALYWNTAPRRMRFLVVVLCILLMVYVLAWMALVYAPHKATPTQRHFLASALTTLALMIDPAFAPKVAEFLAINVLLFGVFAFVDRRLVLIMAFAILPNLLVTTGGAEKNGWSTHYHSLYFPFVSFAAALGLGKLWSLHQSWGRQSLLLGGIFLLIYVLPSVSPAYGKEPTALRRMGEFFVEWDESSQWYRSHQLRKVAQTLPPGATVTTLEQFTAVLQANHTVAYYPVGIDTADYAVLNRVHRSDGTFYFSGAVSYIGVSAQADACLTDRLRSAGYDVDRPKMVMADVVVLARTGNRRPGAGARLP